MNYELLDILGTGKFGEVWRGAHKSTGEIVAIKKEFTESKCAMIKHEATVLHYLYSRGCKQIPLLYWFGIVQESPSIVMTYYEETLDDYATHTNMSKIICGNFMIQMIRIIKSIHEQSILHRDIKPHNFMLKGGQLFLIDFGLSAVYVDDENRHRPPNPPSTAILGTPKYVSIHIHDGLDPSRRDDLMSIGYIYMYLACGKRLPWENIPYNAEHHRDYDETHILHYKNQERKHRKMWDQVNEYCRIIGPEISQYMEKVYSLKYEDRPEYEVLQSVMHLGE
jgi:serine/threonine protein kinase